MTSTLGLETKMTLLAAGLIFLLALVLGVWKYRQIMAAEDHRRTRTSTSRTARRCSTPSRRCCWRSSSNSAPGRRGST